MTNKEILEVLEEALELDRGTLQGTESMDGLEGWDSLRVIAVMAAMDDRCGVTLSPDRVILCKTIEQLIGLIHEAETAKQPA